MPNGFSPPVKSGVFSKGAQNDRLRSDRGLIKNFMEEKIFESVSFQEAKDIIDNVANHVVLDVREEDEYYTGHAENAVNFPVDAIDEVSAEELIHDKDTAVLTYCRSGSRARLAAERLHSLGYRKIYVIGSLVGWPYPLDYD